MDDTLLQNIMLLSRAAQLVLQDDVIESMGDDTITPSRANVLRLLNRQGGQSVNSIASFLGHTKASASLNVEALEKAGFIRKETDPRDRRGLLVSIKPRGRRWLEKAEEQQTERLQKAVGGLSKARQKELSEAIRGVAMDLLACSRIDSSSCLQCCAFESAECVLDAENWKCSFWHRIETRPAHGKRTARRVKAR